METEVFGLSAPRRCSLARGRWWRRVSRGSLLQVLTAAFGESPGGISPPGAPRTVREPLDLHGSRCSAADELRRTAWPCTTAPPVIGWLQVLAEQCSPFGPTPLKNLRPYYGPL